MNVDPRMIHTYDDMKALDPETIILLQTGTALRVEQATGMLDIIIKYNADPYPWLPAMILLTGRESRQIQNRLSEEQP